MTPTEAALWASASAVIHMIYCYVRRSEYSGKRFIVAHPDICLTVNAIGTALTYAIGRYLL